MTFIDLPSDLKADDPQFVARLNDAMRRLAGSTVKSTAAGASPAPAPLPPIVSSGIHDVRYYGARLDGTHDDTAAFVAALADINVALLPQDVAFTAKITSTIELTSGQAVIGHKPVERWRAVAQGAVLGRIQYTGSGACFSVRPTAGTQAAGIDTVYLKGLHVDGLHASPATSGLSVSVLSGSFVEGLYVDDCTIVNFPKHQVAVTGLAFDLKFNRVQAHNRDQTVGDDLIRFYAGGSYQGQVEFRDCYLMQYLDGYWVFRCELTSDCVFLGGTVGPYAVGAGASGIWVNGGLQVLGTHVEGTYPTQYATVGIRYSGSNGAIISPAACATFGVGVQIGDPTAPGNNAVSAIISGDIGNNNTLGTGIAITGATNASPIVLQTATPHGLSEGQPVRVSGVGGNTAAIGTPYNKFLWTVHVVNTTHVALNGSVGSGTYTSGGMIYPLLGADVEIVAGGSRAGTEIHPIGQANGDPVVADFRALSEDVSTEVVDYRNSSLQGLNSICVRGTGRMEEPIFDFRRYDAYPLLRLNQMGQLGVGIPSPHYLVDIGGAYAAVDALAKLGVAGPVVIGAPGGELGTVYILSQTGRYLKITATDAGGVTLATAVDDLNLAPPPAHKIQCKTVTRVQRGYSGQPVDDLGSLLVLEDSQSTGLQIKIPAGDDAAFVVGSLATTHRAQLVYTDGTMEWALICPGGRFRIDRSLYSNSNPLYLYSTATGEGVVVQAQDATAIPLIVQGAASQSAHLQRWIDSVGAIKASLDAAGNFWCAGTYSRVSARRSTQRGTSCATRPGTSTSTTSRPARSSASSRSAARARPARTTRPARCGT